MKNYNDLCTKFITSPFSICYIIGLPIYSQISAYLSYLGYRALRQVEWIDSLVLPVALVHSIVSVVAFTSQHCEFSRIDRVLHTPPPFG